MSKRYKIAYFGTPAFAVEPLKKLIETHDVVCVVAQPDKPQGRGNKLTPPPTKEVALQHNIPVYQPDKLSQAQDLYDFLVKNQIDFLITAAYGKILPLNYLQIPKYKPLNLHGSLLPLYRGASPVQQALLNNDKYTGVTIMEMEVTMDTGAMYNQGKIEIAPEDTTSSLMSKLSTVAADTIVETLARWDSITPTPQDNNKATYCKKIAKEDGLISWNDDYLTIYGKVRGFYPWPSAYFSYNGDMIKIHSAKISANKKSGTDGEILEVGKDYITVACGGGNLDLISIQPPNKAAMSPVGWLNGQRLKSGDKL